MNRYLSTALMFFCLPILALAQPAPNFTIYTTHGDTLNLYEDLLDQDKVVVLEVMFSTCPPCNSIAEDVQDLYESWGEGSGSVEFISLSNQTWDMNANVADYEADHGLTFPGAGFDGGGYDAVQPYVNGTWGGFFGTPTFAVISPDRSVEYDPSGAGLQATLDSVDAAIARAVEGLQPPSYHFSGTVTSGPGYPGAGIAGVMFMLDLPGGSDQLLDAQTDANGQYDFTIDEALPDGTVIRPFLDGEAIDGVTVYDLVLMLRVLAGLKSWDSDLQELQADLNQDGVVNVLDGIELKRLLLAITNDFEHRDPVFFASTAAVETPSGDFMENLPYIPVLNESTEYSIDFFGMKTADLNNSYEF